MAGLRDFIQLQTVSGPPLDVHGATVTPQAQALIVRFGKHGGLVWNRPVAVTVDTGQRTERIPIVDQTRIAQIVIFLNGMLVALIALALLRRAAQRRPPVPAKE